MTTPRERLVDSEHPHYYHLSSRCVRQGWLCGLDELTGRDYSHRKAWIEDRLLELSDAYAVEVYAYAIMSNHFHIVVYYDPRAAERWSDAEVVARWLRVSSIGARRKSECDAARQDARRESLLADPIQVEALRRRLGSLSAFMQHLKQPIAWRANREDGVRGHFFEQRFYSGALLNEQALLAAMAYVDLNPVRAKIAAGIEECGHTSISRRLTVAADSPERTAQVVGPVASGLLRSEAKRSASQRGPSVSLATYVERLRVLATADRLGGWSQSRIDRWRQQVASLQKRQRAYGPAPLLASWLSERGMRPLELEMLC